MRIKNAMRKGAMHQIIHRNMINPKQAPSTARYTWALVISLCCDQRYDDDVVFLQRHHHYLLLRL